VKLQILGRCFVGIISCSFAPSFRSQANFSRGGYPRYQRRVPTLCLSRYWNPHWRLGLITLHLPMHSKLSKTRMLTPLTRPYLHTYTTAHGSVEHLHTLVSRSFTRVRLTWLCRVGVLVHICWFCFYHSPSSPFLFFSSPSPTFPLQAFW